MTPHMTYPEAMIVGLIQGVTELFPVSSLGHNVLLPAIIGGSWANDLSVSKPESPYLAFIVGLHVATAIALLIYFWKDWVRIFRGFISSIRDRDVTTVDQKLAWMIILATIPVGVVGLFAEHEFRVIFAKPVRAAVFLIINGIILYAGERFRTRKSRQADEQQAQERELVGAAAGPGSTTPGNTTSGSTIPGNTTLKPAAAHAAAHASGHRAARQQEIAAGAESDQRLVAMGYLQGTIIGAAQVLALLAGISRDGVTMVTGMFRGLSREDAARFAFLLATPVILAAGALKVGDLIHYGHGIYGQILAGSILSGVGAYVSVRYLIRYFQTRTLTPFAIYCVLAGVACVIYLGFIK
jgi:undecaprenyl-diphosphatase